jgi:GDP-D-mannose 3',5'-epimerase
MAGVGPGGRRRKALVLGAGGFIGAHLVKRLVDEGAWVRGVDLKSPEFGESAADEFVLGDLRNASFADCVMSFHGYERGDFYASVPERMLDAFDEVYQLAADMGGAGFVFTGKNDAEILHNSATINLNVLDSQRRISARRGETTTRIFYSSSACIYPARTQQDERDPDCRESTAYPAEPDSEYGWEKLFSERLYLAYARNHGIIVRIARYHNVYGPRGTWRGGREKAPAAVCRKVAELPPGGGEIEVWGDGLQTRSFLFVDECVEATRRLMDSEFEGPVNVGSEEMVSIDELVATVAAVSGKKVGIRHTEGPLGVRGRNSNNDLVREKLGWDYSLSLREGIERTYAWIDSLVSGIRAGHVAVSLLRLGAEGGLEEDVSRLDASSVRALRCTERALA